MVIQYQLPAHDVNNMLCNGIQLKSLHIDTDKSLYIDTDSDWKHADERHKSEFSKKVRDKVKCQIKNDKSSQYTSISLMRL